MRSKTQFGKVVSSHSSAWGASSFVQKLRIDSRSASCSSVKMKWRFFESKSGLRTFSADVAMAGGDLPRSSDGSPDRSRPGGESKQWHWLLSAAPGAPVRGAIAGEGGGAGQGLGGAAGAGVDAAGAGGAGKLGAGG